uniref:HMG box domain-containing protein n=1 Tax=Clastoptera arizonana TaxID=38151 RepID=A0A1B6CCF6_9HEMI
MIVPSSENLYSDDSDDEVDEIDIPRRKYQLLLERCEVLQQDNERLVNRIQQVQKLLRKSRRERKFLMDRLDRYGDSWRTAPLPVELDEPIDGPNFATQIPSKPAKVQSSNNSDKSGTNRKSTSSNSNTGGKRKTHKAPVDPNAPKRPANPFFQYCQEQRSIVLEHLVSTNGSEPTKQEVTKQLASKWNSLTTDDKKAYYDMYEKSKERYAADMQIYSLNKSKPQT